MGLVNDLVWVGLWLGVVGTCCGIGLAAAALVISRTYDAARRASMLVITDGFFSVAGVVCAWLAVWLLTQQVHWAGVYFFVGLVAVAVVTLAAVSEFPETQQYADADPSPGTWPVSAWLCIAALCTYTLAQNAILWWLPQYAQGHLQASAESAGGLVGQFWSGMFAAQLFVAWWVLKIGVQRLPWLATGSTFALSIPLWWLPDMEAMWAMAALWGFGNLGLLTVLLSYATQFTEVASPRLVSGLLLGATTGTAISPWLSSQVVSWGEPRTALMFGSAMYLLMLLLLVAAVWQRGRAT